MFLSLYFDNLIMLEFRDVWEKDCCVCSCERRERILFIYIFIEMYEFFKQKNSFGVAMVFSRSRERL